MKKLFLLAITAIFSLNLFCQINWIKHPDNPVLVPGSAEEWEKEVIWPNSVLYYDSIYHMWYTGGIVNAATSIGRATSPDGITWTKDTNNPVLSKGQSGDWDENYLQGGPVLIIDTMFHMWYTGQGGKDLYSNHQIGHATSADGITWTKDTNNPVLSTGQSGDWDGTWIMVGSVLYDGSEYHMWYGGYEGVIGPRFGHATSPDGVTWEKDTSNPVLSFGAAGSWDYPRVDFPSVIFDGTTYHMWYGGGNIFTWQIGYATSEDGSVWTKFGNPVLRHGSAGSWDAESVLPDAIIDSAGVKYKMWYGGGSNGKASIGYAESLVPAWNKMEPMDIKRGYPVSSVIDKMIYVFGGQDYNMATISSARAYNTITNEWSDLATMPEDLSWGPAEVVNGKIYLMGGWRNINGDWITTNSTVEYDPNGDSWQEKSACPDSMGSMASCVLNDTIYILGGSKDYDPTDQNKALYYVPGMDSWGSLPDMIFERPIGLSTEIVDNKIYVIGGTYESGWNNPTGKAEVYDPQLKTWTELADMPVPVTHHISVIHDSKIMVFGGDSSSVYSPDALSIGSNIIQEYDPSTDSWSLLKPMPIKRAGMTGQKVGNYVYLLGGYLNSWDLDEPLSEVWRFDLESPNPHISVTGISLDKNALDLTAGYTKTLVSTVSPFVASVPSVSWASGNAAVATVANGTVTGVASGEAYVYVTTTDGNFKDSCLVTVENISQVRFGSTGDPLNGLTVTWNNSGTSDSIAWGYTANHLEGSFAGSIRENKFGIPVFDYTFPSLSAGSTIHYALFDSKDSKWTEERTFKTASDASNNKFSFTVLGDSRTYPDQWQIISEAALDTDFTLFMGDIMEDGAIKSDWDDWFEYGKEFIAREPVYHCIGNHDEDNSPTGFDAYLSIFTLPGVETYYSFTYGNAIFICLNTQEPGDTEQYNWLLST
ncbi:MAG: Ig-like domain-containing protein, partial [Bacteroidales bacterium]|nr:Ig-like domain-containing protein [Bacteroidales bacterium]